MMIMSHLKQLRAVADGLRVLHDDPDDARAGPVGDLDPVARHGRLGRQVDRDGRDRVGVGVAVQLGHLAKIT